MKEILKYTPLELIAILTIILGLFAYGLWISHIAEQRCIKGARESSMDGNVPSEIVNFCKNTF